MKQSFESWTEQVIGTRLIQEYETIKGLLVTAKLAEDFGLASLEEAMERVQDKFGQETVNIALDVTLKVGMRREKLQSVMLSDHFINYTMSIDSLDGHMEFLNCPIYGSHRYAKKNTELKRRFPRFSAGTSVLPMLKQCLTLCFRFHLLFGSPNASATRTNCEFYLKLAYSPVGKDAGEVCSAYHVLERHPRMQHEM